MSNSEFKFYCSHCDQPLKCDPCHAGRQIQCPGCNHLIRIPNPPAGSGFTHVHPDDAPQARRYFAELLHSPGCLHTCDLRVEHADGSWRLTATASPSPP